MTSQNSGTQNWLSWDKAKDLLTLLVVPALLWVSAVSTNLEVLKLKVDSQSEAITKLETKIENQATKNNNTSERLARLEARIESIGERINEIRNILVNNSNNRNTGDR